MYFNYPLTAGTAEVFGRGRHRATTALAKPIVSAECDTAPGRERLSEV